MPDFEEGAFLQSQHLDHLISAKQSLPHPGSRWDPQPSQNESPGGCYPSLDTQPTKNTAMGPFSMPIFTPRRGSLLHADFHEPSQTLRRTADRARVHLAGRLSHAADVTEHQIKYRRLRAMALVSPVA
jgi:hypothetical protein